MADAGMVNVGQLARQDHGRTNVFIVGFGTHSGTVLAASQWGGAIERMTVPAAQAGSWEDILHRQGSTNKILYSNKLQSNKALQKRLGNRAIGVVYDPANEARQLRSYGYPAPLRCIYIHRSHNCPSYDRRAACKDEPPDTYRRGTSTCCLPAVARQRTHAQFHSAKYLNKHMAKDKNKRKSNAGATRLRLLVSRKQMLPQLPTTRQNQRRKKWTLNENHQAQTSGIERRLYHGTVKGIVMLRYLFLFVRNGHSSIPDPGHSFEKTAQPTDEI